MRATSNRVPLASVIVAVLNRKEEIGKCISSLLRQDYPNYEILVVDGGSKDGTWESLQAQAKKSKKLRALQDLRPGRNPARNTGIEKAKGEFIIFTDSDCVPEKNWVSELLKPFKNPEVGGVIGTTSADRKGPFWYHMENKYRQFIGHNNAYRAEVVRKIGGFDENFKIAKEDTDFSFRVIEKGWKVVYQPSANLTHTSRRVSVFFRIKNQETHIYDGLLYHKHPDLYKEFYGNHIFPKGYLPILAAALYIPAAFTLLFFSPAVAAVMFAAYIFVAIDHLYSEASDGNALENLNFILFAWIVPIARIKAFLKGYFTFRFRR